MEANKRIQSASLTLAYACLLPPPVRPNASPVCLRETYPQAVGIPHDETRLGGAV